MQEHLQILVTGTALLISVMSLCALILLPTRLEPNIFAARATDQLVLPHKESTRSAPATHRNISCLFCDCYEDACI